MGCKCRILYCCIVLFCLWQFILCLTCSLFLFFYLTSWLGPSRLGSGNIWMNGMGGMKSSFQVSEEVPSTKKRQDKKRRHMSS